MATGYTQSPKLLKGALIKIGEDFLGPIPNIILFQYNPEKMTRTLQPSNTSTGGKKAVPTTAEPSDPSERFDLSLILDAADALEEPEKHPVAFISGVADRIAALEMLMYPAKNNLIGQAISSLLSSGETVSRCSVPVTLFAWGPGRLLPVRLTSFSVEEQAFSPILYPIRASVSVQLEVLTPESFKKDELTVAEQVAVAAYQVTRTQKEALAMANLTNTVESTLGLLPF